MNGLYYLAHLVRLKNNLNRERRRFYKMMNPKFKLIPRASGIYWCLAYIKVPIKRTVPLRFSKAGYNNARREMKAMTAHMRQVREEIGARFAWGDSGNIQAIILENVWYKTSDIEVLANHYEADQILLVEG
jgi:hypothetical protein